MALPATEGFSGGSGALPDPPWTHLNNTIDQDGSGAGTVTAAGSDCLAVWNADSFGSDQSASITAKSTLSGDASQYLGLVLRSDGFAEGSGTMYQFFTDGGSDTRIVKVLAGTFSDLDTNNAVTVAVDDVLEFSVVGTALEVTLNGSPILTATDSDIAGGTTGIVAGSQFGAGFLFFDDWTADSSGGGGGGGTSPFTVTGRGSVTIISPAFLKIETDHADYPVFVTSGNAEPPNYYHVGMISWGTANGAMTAYPVTREVDLVEVPAGMDTLWYEFASGITAVITELADP